VLYRDIVWHFLADQPGRRRSPSEPAAYQLRVLDNEQALFEFGTSPSARVYSVRFPSAFVQGDETRSRSKGIGRDVGRLRLIALRLWNLLPAEVVEPLRSGAESDAMTRLKICSGDPLVNDLPWELLLGDGTGGNVVIVRTVPALTPAPPSSVKRPLKVLVVLTSPKDAMLLQPRQEFAAVELGLREAELDFCELSEPTAAAARQMLTDYQPHVVHYIGHAGVSRGAGALILHDANQGTEWLPADELAPSLPLSVRLICLSSCFTAPNYNVLGLSRLAHASAELKLPSMIFNQYEPPEQAVRAFWSAFYPALDSADSDLTRAFIAGRRAVQAHKVEDEPADGGAFGLVIREGSDRPFRFEQDVVTPDRFAAEIQAQFASRSVNEMAEKIRMLGTSASQSQRLHLREAFGQATDLLKKLQ
jgi:hypothetical protein